jgi:hypothetical protein
MNLQVIPLAVLLFLLNGGCNSTRQLITPARLAGTWVKPINIKPPSGKPEKEGFTLNFDGTIVFVNIHSMAGDTWKLENDTLTFWSHTERFPHPQPVKYIVVHLSSSQLELRPVKNARGYSDKYKRKR